MRANVGLPDSLTSIRVALAVGYIRGEKTELASWMLSVDEAAGQQKDGQATVWSDPLDDWPVPSDQTFQSTVITVALVPTLQGSPNFTATATLYSLEMEVHELRVSEESVATRSYQSMERQLKRDPSPILRNPDGAAVALGTFQDLFTAGTPALGADMVREYRVRTSAFNGLNPPRPPPAILTITKLGRLTEPFQITIPMAAPSSHDDQLFSVSEEFQIDVEGLQKEPGSLFSVSLSLADIPYPDTPVGNMAITDLVLEAHDRPRLDLHLAPAEQMCLEVAWESINLGSIEGSNPGTSPFTVSVWVSNMMDEYQGDEGDNILAKYPILVHGATYQLMIRGDGALCALVNGARGGHSTAVYANTAGLQGQDWHYLTLTWTGSALRLGIDGRYQPETTDTAPALIPTPVDTILGSTSFAARFRSVMFWDDALTDDELAVSMYSLDRTSAPLLACFQFTSPEPVVLGRVSSPFKDVPLAPKMVIESQGLAVADGGCALLSGNDAEALHFTDAMGYTLEAWIAPVTWDPSIRILAGKFDSPTSGYGLQLRGKTLVAIWGSTVLESAQSIFVGDWRNPRWSHVATTFDPNTQPRTSSLPFMSCMSTLPNSG